MQSANQMTLHTGGDCILPWARNETGKPLHVSCDSYYDNNVGCSVVSAQSDSYGSGFNNAGGGAYVMQHTEDGVKIWIFSKARLPSDIGSDHPNPDHWPIPDAAFPFSTECPPSRFGPQQIVFDLTFCGVWAGAVYPSSGCPGSSCEEFVANNPSAFQDYYFGIKSLKVYQQKK